MFVVLDMFGDRHQGMDGFHDSVPGPDGGGQATVNLPVGLLGGTVTGFGLGGHGQFQGQGKEMDGALAMCGFGPDRIAVGFGGQDGSRVGGEVKAEGGRDAEFLRQDQAAGPVCCLIGCRQ